MRKIKLKGVVVLQEQQVLLQEELYINRKEKRFIQNIFFRIIFINLFFLHNY